MAMVVLRRFATISEAEAAAGALRAAGLHPTVLDQNSGPPFYSGAASLVGFRLAIPGDEAQDAVEILRMSATLPIAPGEVDPYDAPDEAWWDETGGQGIGIMPAVRKTGRIFVWLILLMPLIFLAAQMLGWLR